MTRVNPDDDWRAAAISVGLPAVALVHASSLELAAHRLTIARRLQAAASVYYELLRREPTHHNGLLNLITILPLQGRRGEVAPLYRRLIESETARLDLPRADHDELVQFRLAEAGLAPCPDRAPAAEVARRFDDYAAEYDAHLVDMLGYRGPEVVLRAVEAAAGAPAADLDVLDLGCGTGLAGRRLRSLARRLDGIDLSAAMLAKARDAGVYDGLDTGDVTDLPASRPDSYDLAVAVEVLIYLGDLAPVFCAVATALRPGGRFAFTVEPGTEPGYSLGGQGRFVHAPEYLRNAAAAAGFAVLSLDEVVVRREQGQDVRSLVVVLRKTD